MDNQGRCTNFMRSPRGSPLTKAALVCNRCIAAIKKENGFSDEVKDTGVKVLREQKGEGSRACRTGFLFKNRIKREFRDELRVSRESEWSR